jgi:hypothetical protein
MFDVEVLEPRQPGQDLVVIGVLLDDEQASHDCVLSL